MDDLVTAYAEDVVAGRIVAGPHVRNTCARHLRDLEHGHERGLVWDLEAANRAIGIFPKYFRLNGGHFEGKPFTLHPSQAFRVGSLFGWKNGDGTRRFRRFYDEEGKGNGKSPLLAGIGLIGLMFDGEPRAEIYAAASKKDQAQILFKDAVAMVQQSPKLAGRIRAMGIEPVWSLIYTGKSGDRREFKPVSSDEGKSGPRPHFALCDEVHEHRTRDTIDMLERGFKFRKQPLLIMATNSGTDRKSICWEERQHAIKVAAGLVDDDTTFSYVCALDEDDDWLNDPSCWIKVNPLLGTILTYEYLEGIVAQARMIPGKRNGIARLHFCVWTEAENVWIPPEVWAACEDESLRFEDMTDRKCWGGLDLSAKADMTARALVFDDGYDDDGQPKYILWVHGYLPQETLTARAEIDQAPYDVWEREGFLTATPGNFVKFDHVVKDLADDAGQFEFQGLAFDVWMFERFKADLDEYGLDITTVEHPQGWNRRRDVPLYMPTSIEAIEQVIFERRVRIFVNPALRAAVMSVVFEEAASGLRKFHKRKATARIDLAVAATMAIGFATIGSETDAGWSGYLASLGVTS